MRRAFPALCAAALALGPALALAAPPAPPLWPQVRIDHVDVSQWPKVRIVASVLDAKGRALPPKLLERVEVLAGKGKAAAGSKNQPAEVWFSAGKPMEGRKDAKLVPRDKSELGLGVALVVAGYGEGMPAGTQERLRESLQVALKQLGKNDRASVLWYGDRLWQSVALGSYKSRLGDLERLREPCQEALEAGRTGLALPPGLVGKLGKDAEAPAPGTHLCGLTADHKSLAGLVAQQAFSGAFPRLFNLGPGFYQPSRYCTVPPGQLDGFGELIADNYNRQTAEREVLRAAGKPLDFETSAIDEALRTLLADSRPGERKALLLISDGRDGYVRDLQLCQDHPPPACASVDRQKDREGFAKCMQGVLTQRMATQQEWFRQKAEQWLGLARAGEVQIHAVGLASLGAPHELERLRLLAERSGGTYRAVEDDARLADVVARTMGELNGQLVLDYVAQAEDGPAEAPDEPEERTLRVGVKLSRALSEEGPLVSAPVTVRVAAALPWRERMRERARALWLAQEARFGRQRLLLASGIAGGALGLSVLLVLALGLRKLLRRKK